MLYLDENGEAKAAVVYRTPKLFKTKIQSVRVSDDKSVVRTMMLDVNMPSFPVFFAIM